MPQMSPLLWMVYPYVMMTVMLIFLSTLVKEDVEMGELDMTTMGEGVEMLW